MAEIFRIEAADKGFPELSQPEPYAILLMLRSMRTTYWQGGLADQPYFLLKELDAAAAGEAKHRNRELENQMNRLKEDN